MRGVFVTGTDTNIGKTIAASALLHRYRAAAPLRYWKPIQTGFPADDDIETVRRLGGCAPEEVCAAGIRLPEPLSPHEAARRAGTTIRVEQILALLAGGSEKWSWIVEGAGGVLVPINETVMMIDLIRALALPAVVVARSGLGTINHTLLTLEALRFRSIPVAGVILAGESNPENAAAVEKFGAVQVIGQLPYLENLNAASLSAWALRKLDPGGRLERMLSGEEA